MSGDKYPKKLFSQESDLQRRWGRQRKVRVHPKGEVLDKTEFLDESQTMECIFIGFLDILLF